MPIDVNSIESSIPARIRVQTLGRFVVEVEGSPLRFDARGQRKPLELLKVLIALGGVNVPEERLSDALWPEAEGDAAHNSFASTLHRLRRLIGNEALHLRDKRLSLDPDLCLVDALEFERAMDRAAAALSSGDPEASALLEEALSLYGGPFLDGEFEPPEILPTRERLHGLLLNRVEEMGRAFHESKNLSQAIALYRRSLEIDPLSESLSRELMRCHLAAGEAAAGLAAYRRCRDLLQSTYNVEPSPETEAVHQALAALEPETASSQSTISSEASFTMPVPHRRRKSLLATLVVGLALLAGAGWTGWMVYDSRKEGWALADFQEQAAFPLPDRPSIAVLAFENLSGDPAQEYFSDGLSGDIITKLASLTDLFVIARNSSFQYKGKQVDVRQIGRELGVRYVLEGSVQKSAERVRITAQLIDAATGEHLFAERYDREFKDIFAMQDEIAYRVLADIHVKLGRGEAISHFLRSTNNFAAFDAYMRAVAQLHKFEKEASFKARELCLKAIELDPKYATAMAYLGFVYIQQARRGWVPDPEKARRLAADWAQRAFELDPDNAVGLRLLSRLQSEKGNHQEAIVLGKRSVELNPSDAIAYSTLAFTYLLARQPEPALQAINQTLRLAPHSPPLYHWFAGVANDWNGRHETAVSEFKKVVAKANGGIFLRAGLGGLILSYMKMGEEDQAKAAAEKLIKAYPGYTISGYVRGLKIFTFKDFNWLEENVEILRKMGLPE